MGVDEEELELTSITVRSVTTVVSGSAVVVDNKVESVTTSTNSDLITLSDILLE